MAAINKDRWGSDAEGVCATRYRPEGIDRNVAGVQKHARSPLAIDGGSFKRRSKTYAAVAAGDRSNVVQDDVAAAATRADQDTGSAVAANPVTWIRDAIRATDAIHTVTSVSSDAIGAAGAQQTGATAS